MSDAMREALTWRKSDYTEGPNECGYYTAGIDTPQLDIFGKPDWHGHAIQFHHKDKAEAERRRDLALNAALAPQPALDPDYVLMPREATRDMTMAGCDSLPSCEHVFGHAGEMLRNAYRKMVEVGSRK